MTRSWALFLAAALLSLQALFAPPVGAEDFFVFPLKLSLPIRMVEVGSPGNISDRKLSDKDVVNLALGRPLGTKINKSKEVLAVVAARSNASAGKVVVLDPSKNGVAQVTTVVALPNVIDAEDGILPKGTQGHGTVTGQVQNTTLGDPSKNALHSSSMWGSGAGTATVDHKLSVKGIIAGRMSLTITEEGQTKSFAGFIVNGKGSVSGKPISMFDDGTFQGCGDDIVQPGLGEECEFVHQEACPGNCDACRCVVCGDGNKDPGEICDPPDNDICEALSPTSYCEPDCGGCTFCGNGIVEAPEECDPLGGADTACPGQCNPQTCMCP